MTRHDAQPNQPIDNILLEMDKPMRVTHEIYGTESLKDPDARVLMHWVTENSALYEIYEYDGIRIFNEYTLDGVRTSNLVIHVRRLGSWHRRLAKRIKSVPRDAINAFFRWKFNSGRTGFMIHNYKENTRDRR